MTDLGCPREREVARAVARGGWSDELGAHVADCDACSDLLLVAGALRRAADVAEDDTPLPDPGLIWWRAQLQARVVASDRLSRLLRLSYAVAGGLAGAVVLLLLPRLSGPLSGWLSGVASLAQTTASAAGAANPGLVLAVSAVMLLLLAAADARLGGA